MVDNLAVDNPVDNLVVDNLVVDKRPSDILLVDNLEEVGRQQEVVAGCNNSFLYRDFREINLSSWAVLIAERYRCRLYVGVGLSVCRFYTRKV